jgi:hypothetical protein
MCAEKAALRLRMPNIYPTYLHNVLQMQNVPLL